MNSSFRLVGVFHGVAHQSHTSYPVKAKQTDRLGPHIVDSSGLTGFTPCGRRRDRIRHFSRPSHVAEVDRTLKLASLNVQGLRWDSLSAREKLQDLLRFARQHSTDIIFLSDLHSTGEATVYIEEFVLVTGDTTGFLLSHRVRRRWQEHGAKILHGLRFSALPLVFAERTYMMTSVYMPTGSIPRRRAAYNEAATFRESAISLFGQEDLVEIWAGDWNAHVAADEPGIPDLAGDKGLSTPTTDGGRIQRQWQFSQGLMCFDSFQSVSHRGTWYHNIAKSWYELDYFVGSPCLRRSVQHICTAANGLSDHMAKITTLHASKPGAHAARARRKAYYLQADRHLLPGKLALHRLRGQSPDARQLQQQLRSQVVANISAQSEPEDASSDPDSRFLGCVWPTSLRHSPGNTVYISTDGSGDASGGWGCFVQHGQAQLDLFGPLHLNGTKATNNTAELEAMAHAFLWLLQDSERHGLAPSTPAVIRFDSFYAANMVRGFWRPQGNHELITLCKQLLAAVRLRRAVFFVHVKGHTGDEGNERADSNANKGTRGLGQYFEHNFDTALELALHWSTQAISTKPAAKRIVGKRRGAGQQTRDTINTPESPWFMQATWPSIPPPEMSWASLADALVSAADTVVGRAKPNGLTDMNTPEDQAKLQAFRREKEQAFEQLRMAMGTPDEGEARKRMHLAQRGHARFKARARWRGISRVVRQLEDAHRHRDSSQFFSLLRKLGVHLDGRSREGQEQFSLEKLREHVLEVSGTVKDVSDEIINRWGPQQPVEHSLADLPSELEVCQAMRVMRDSAGGKDEVTLGLIRAGGPRVQRHIVDNIRYMWRAHPSQWEDIVKSGVMLPHFKKGDRSDLNNYRFICLLCLLSRIMARIVASRVSEFAERKDLLPPHQWGFRTHRSSIDPIFVMRVLAELANTVDWQQDPDLVPIIVVLWDLRKAYPSTQRFPAYKLYARMGFPDKLLQILYGLHDSIYPIPSAHEGGLL